MPSTTKKHKAAIGVGVFLVLSALLTFLWRHPAQHESSAVLHDVAQMDRQQSGPGRPLGESYARGYVEQRRQVRLPVPATEITVMGFDPICSSKVVGRVEDVSGMAARDTHLTLLRYLDDERMQLASRATSEENGTFELEFTHHGLHVLHARGSNAGEGLGGTATVDSLLLAEGQLVTLAPIVLAGEAILEGSLMFPDGRPASDVHLAFESEELGECAGTDASQTLSFAQELEEAGDGLLEEDVWTDENGSFRLAGMQEGTYCVRHVQTLGCRDPIGRVSSGAPQALTLNAYRIRVFALDEERRLAVPALTTVTNTDSGATSTVASMSLGRELAFFFCESGTFEVAGAIDGAGAFEQVVVIPAHAFDTAVTVSVVARDEGQVRVIVLVTPQHMPLVSIVKLVSDGGQIVRRGRPRCSEEVKLVAPEGRYTLRWEPALQVPPSVLLPFESEPFTLRAGRTHTVSIVPRFGGRVVLTGSVVGRVDAHGGYRASIVDVNSGHEQPLLSISRSSGETDVTLSTQFGFGKEELVRNVLAPGVYDVTLQADGCLISIKRIRVIEGVDNYVQFDMDEE